MTTIYSTWIKIKSITALLVMLNLVVHASGEEDWQSSPKKVCTLDRDLSHDFTECDKETNTMKVFFYYPTELRCDYAHSDMLPTFMKDVPCEKLCDNGHYTKIRIDENRNPSLVCDKCPADSIAIRGGFSYDPRVTSSRFPDATSKDMSKFKATCRIVKFDKARGEDQLTISDNCQSWGSSGRSLIAQHPHTMMESERTQEQVEFKLAYEDTFIGNRGSVRFQYKSAQKQNKGILNGIFRFKVDGVQ